MKYPNAVYITRDTRTSRVEVWDAEIGIVKVRGSIEYESGS